MNLQLISAILKGAWAIDQESALSYAPLINNLIGNTGIKVEFNFNDQQFKIFGIERSTKKYSKWDGWNNTPKNSIAVIPISGPLMKQDQFCGPVGMETIGQIIKDADASQNIDGIILKIDSPGGTVDGTHALAEIVKNTQKPIIAFADGLMASAALWIGSSADEIIAADNKTKIGSVGVLMSFADLQPAYELLGVKFHQIVSNLSTDKTKMFDDIRKGNYDTYKKEVLDPLAKDFIDTIKSNLPNVKDDQLTGKVFFAEDVVGSLVNSIGNFDTAVSRMNEIISQNESKSKSNKTTAMNKKFETVEKVIGSKLESSDEGVYMNEDQLEAINTALATGETNAADLITANAAKTQAEADLATANQTIQDKDAEIAILKQKGGSNTASAISDKETVKDPEKKDGNVTSKEKSFLENLEAVEKLL